MNLEEMKNRIAQLTQMTENTAAQHNAAVGRLQEVKDLLAYMEEKGKEVISAVEKKIEDTVGNHEKPIASDPNIPATSHDSNAPGSSTAVPTNPEGAITPLDPIAQDPIPAQNPNTVNVNQ